MSTVLFRSRSGTRTEYTGLHVDTRPTESSHASLSAILLNPMIRAMLTCHGSEKSTWRARVVSYLKESRNRDVCIDELLRLCTSIGGPDGLDSAIDVLSQTGGTIVEYAWAYLKRDIVNWTPNSDRAYRPNDDYWHILLRSVARANVDELDRLRFILCCSSAESQEMRESVVEALRDLGTERAKKFIREISKTDLSSNIRASAAAALSDMES